MSASLLLCCPGSRGPERLKRKSGLESPGGTGTRGDHTYLVSFLTIQIGAFTGRSFLLSFQSAAGIKVAWGENSFLAAKYILEKKQIANGSCLNFIRM